MFNSQNPLLYAQRLPLQTLRLREVTFIIQGVRERQNGIQGVGCSGPRTRMEVTSSWRCSDSASE